MPGKRPVYPMYERIPCETFKQYLNLNESCLFHRNLRQTKTDVFPQIPNRKKYGIYKFTESTIER